MFEQATMETGSAAPLTYFRNLRHRAESDRLVKTASGMWQDMMEQVTRNTGWVVPQTYSRNLQHRAE